LRDELESLLGEVCVHGGYCSLSAEAERAITMHQKITADEFARAVLEAEGFDHPEYELALLRMLKRMFFDWFGRATVSVADFGTPGTKEFLRLKPPRPK
jgi:hypothetical protein